MDLDEYTYDFTKYFEEQVKVFGKETGIKFDDTFAGNLTSKIGNLYINKLNIEYRKLGKNLSEKDVDRLKRDIYSDTIKEFTETVMRNTLYQKGPVNSGFTPMIIGDGSYASKIAKDPDKYENYINSLFNFVNNISIAYLTHHDLDMKYNPVNLGIDTVEFSNIIAPIYNEQTTNIDKYMADPKFDVPYKTDLLIEELDNAFSDTALFEEDLTDESYTNVIDSAVAVGTNHLRVIDPTDKKLNIEDKMTLKVEKLATAYTALRDHYQKKNFFQKWFTPSGWKESRKINETREKMMDLLGYTSINNFNENMKFMSLKPTYFAYSKYDTLDECHTEYKYDKLNVEEKVYNELNKDYLKKQVEISDNELDINTTKVKNNDLIKSNKELEKEEIINSK